MTDWLADASAFSRPNSKAGEERPGDKVDHCKEMSLRSVENYSRLPIIREIEKSSSYLENDLKGNEKNFQLMGGSSYRGFELPGVDWSNLSAEKLEKRVTTIGRQLSPQYGHVILISGYLYRQLLIHHNMYAQYQVGFPVVRMDGRMDGRTGGQVDVRWRDYQNFLAG